MRHKMNIALMLCCLCLPLLASCGRIVGNTLLYNEWRRGCPGFPSRAEVESVLAEHQELVQRIEKVVPAANATYEAKQQELVLREDVTLDELSVIADLSVIAALKDSQVHYVWVYINSCPGGSYIDIEYLSASQRVQILKILDEAGAREEGPRTFFGVPFLLSGY